MKKTIILAAGQGTRLRPLTDEIPKTMVEINGSPIIHHQVKALKSTGFNEIHVVAGYRADKLESDLWTTHINPRFDQTNMVSSLFITENLFNGDADILITYGDIVYDVEVLDALKSMAGNQVSMIYDLDWFKLWSERMDDPLSDAESFKIDENGLVKELGKKAKDSKDVEGQYIGLIHVSANFAPKFFELYKSLSTSKELFDGQDFDNMYMTSYLQMLINQGIEVKGVPIKGGWVEIDSVEDKSAYEKLIDEGRMAEFCKTLSK